MDDDNEILSCLAIARISFVDIKSSESDGKVSPAAMAYSDVTISIVDFTEPKSINIIRK